MKSLIARQTNLSAHTIQFCRFLRDNVYEIGPNEEADILIAFSQMIPRSFDQKKALYRSILVKNRKQFIQFDELYDQYWEELSKAEDSKKKDLEEQTQKPQKAAGQKSNLQVLKQWLYGGRIEEEKDIATYSAFEALSKKDFASFVSDEQKELLQIIKIIAQRMANKLSRRYTKSRSKRHLDLRRTIKQSIKNGVEINQFYFKEQQKRKVNLVLICDVSKSMELYSRFLIEFMYGFQQVVDKLHTFVFSTKLISLSRALKDGDYEQVLNNLSDQVPHWSGGTRIGESLNTFKQNYGQRLLNKDSIVIILSDGWDTGDIDLLASSMKYIHKKSDRVIWLNPLAGNPDYKPTTKGMEASIPYIDVFTSAHNIDSLREVIKHLKKKKYKPKFA